MKKRIYTDIETILNNQLVAYTHKIARKFNIKTSQKTKATLIAEINDKIRDERLVEKARQIVVDAMKDSICYENTETIYVENSHDTIYVEVYYVDGDPYFAYIRFDGIALIRYSRPYDQD